MDERGVQMGKQGWWSTGERGREGAWCDDEGMRHGWAGVGSQTHQVLECDRRGERGGSHFARLWRVRGEESLEVVVRHGLLRVCEGGRRWVRGESAPTLATWTRMLRAIPFV